MTPFEIVVRDLLAAGNGARFRAAGDSMYPAIRDGELVGIVPCDVSRVRRGDIVLAATTRGLTLHRIVRISSGGIITRGDNATCDDGIITSANLLGRATNRPTRNYRWRSAAKSVKIIRFAAELLRRLRSVQFRFQR
jgi:signal peptidase I